MSLYRKTGKTLKEKRFCRLLLKCQLVPHAVPKLPYAI